MEAKHQPNNKWIPWHQIQPIGRHGLPSRSQHSLLVDMLQDVQHKKTTSILTGVGCSEDKISPKVNTLEWCDISIALPEVSVSEGWLEEVEITLQQPGILMYYHEDVKVHQECEEMDKYKIGA